MPRINHFEYVYDDPDRAAKFYADAFGWKTEKWQAPDGGTEYWMVTTGPDSEQPGINGGFMKPADEHTPKVMNTLTVNDIDEACKKVEAAGGSVMQPKMTIPGIGYQAYCTDPGGIAFGLHQSDETAK